MKVEIVFRGSAEVFYHKNCKFTSGRLHMMRALSLLTMDTSILVIAGPGTKLFVD
jgi:hypothetical protein